MSTISNQGTPAPNDHDLTKTAICQLLAAKAPQQADLQAFSSVDWQILAQVAEAEGVAALLYWRIKKGPLKFDIPASVQDFLKRSYYQVTARNALLLKELKYTLDGFEEAKIPVVALKGASMASTLYPDPGLRPMSDLDLFVRPDDLVSASRMLQGLGYTQEKVTYHAYLRGGADGQATVELHWSQVLDGQGRSPELDWLWSQTQPFTGFKDSAYIQCFNPAAQFVYLTGHLMLQTDPSQRRLIWFYDLYQLYEQFMTDFDWAGLLEGKATRCWAPWIQATLYQLRDLFGIQLPALLTDHPPKMPHRPDTQTLTRQYIQSALSQLDRGTRLQVAIGLLFPPKSYLVWRYRIQRPWLWPFYLPRRWWEIGRYLIQARG